MQIIFPLSPGPDGMTYTNAPTCAVFKVPRFYAYVTSISETRTVSCTGSASHTSCSMQGGD